jgi:hypothetical protein
MPREAIEDAALLRLVHYLEMNGHAVRIRSRPDREPHVGRAVDAELEVDGRLVGVEITELVPGARSHREIARLEQAVERGIRTRVRTWPPGHVLVDAEFRELPPARTLRAAETVLATEIASCIDGLDPAPDERCEIALATAIGFIRRLKITYLPTVQAGFGWIVGSDEWGGWLTPIADRYVDQLVATKWDQLEAYREGWVTIVDGVGLLDAHDLSEAFLARQQDIPANWTRIWLLPASDLESVSLIHST